MREDHPKESPNRATNSKTLAIYYAVTPRSLVLTLNEPLLKRAFERQAGRASTNVVSQALPNIPPWLAPIFACAWNKVFAAIRAMARDSYQGRLQQLARNNLPILNEWKKLYPDQNPVQVHETFWGTKLLCPGGGACMERKVSDHGVHRLRSSGRSQNQFDQSDGWRHTRPTGS